MLISKRSMFSGKTHTLEIPVTLQQLEAWANGMLIQDAMPNIIDWQREFRKTGITPEEWEVAFGREEDEDTD